MAALFLSNALYYFNGEILPIGASFWVPSRDFSGGLTLTRFAVNAPSRTRNGAGLSFGGITLIRTFVLECGNRVRDSERRSASATGHSLQWVFPQRPRTP
jgi:hypothetical protein